VSYNAGSARGAANSSAAGSVVCRVISITTSIVVPGTAAAPDAGSLPAEGAAGAGGVELALTGSPVEERLTIALMLLAAGAGALALGAARRRGTWHE
jgi:hypothetical protein